MSLRKIYALYINELIKIIHKPFYAIMALITAGVMILSGIGMNAVTNYNYEEEYPENEEISSWYGDYSRDCRAEIERIEDRIVSDLDLLAEAGSKTAEDEWSNAYFDVIESVYEMEYQIYEAVSYELREEYAVMEYTGFTYLDSAISVLADFERKAYLTEYAGRITEKYPEAAKLENAIGGLSAVIDEVTVSYSDNVSAEDYEAVLKDRSFKKYTELKNAEIENDKLLSDKTKELQIKSNNMILNIAPDGNFEAPKVKDSIGAIESHKDYRTMVYEGVKADGTRLSECEIDEYNKIADELEHAINNKATGFGGELRSDYSSVLKSMITIGAAFAGIIIISCAATIISDEMQSGSIKALVIAPVKRGKIYIAKLLAVITLCLAFAFLIFFIVLIMKVLLGYGTSPVVYTGSKGATHVSYYLYLLVMVFTEFVKIFMYALFGMMVSALVRSSSTSTSIAFFEYIGITNILPAFYNGMLTGTVVGRVTERFLPKHNFALLDRIFPQKAITVGVGDVFDLLVEIGVKPYYEIPLGFSICYILVLGFCLFYIGYDSFARRDIK